MRYLRKYNESINYDDILLNCLDLIDNGFEVQELSGALSSNFMFRLKRKDRITLPEGVEFAELDNYLESISPDNIFYVIKDKYTSQQYAYTIAAKDVEKEITGSQRELLVDLVSITERLARYLRRGDMAVKVSFENKFQQLTRRVEAASISIFNEIYIDFLFEHATKLIPMLENKKEKYIEYLRWDIPKQGQIFIDLMKEEMVYLFDDSSWMVTMESGSTAIITLSKRGVFYQGQDIKVNSFLWSDIKDYIIPFLQRNKNDWTFFDFSWQDRSCKKGENVKIVGIYGGIRYFTIEDLINDSYKLAQFEWRSISFKIKMTI
jgi:hypothetical protein